MSSSHHQDDDASFNPFMADPDEDSRRSSALPEVALEHGNGGGGGFEDVQQDHTQAEVQQQAQQVPLPPPGQSQYVEPSSFAHGNEEEQGQAPAPPQPVRRPTRLTLRDNLDWKDEIKVG